MALLVAWQTSRIGPGRCARIARRTCALWPHPRPGARRPRAHHLLAEADKVDDGALLAGDAELAAAPAGAHPVEPGDV